MTVTIVVVTVGLALFFRFAPTLIDQINNTIIPGTPNPISQRAASLHEGPFVADLHADPLLWGRNLLDRSQYGHVDIPRLIEANVALQAFTVATQVPLERNLTSTPSRHFDLITPLAITQRWPLSSWWSIKERALYQAEKLHQTAQKSDGKFILIRTHDELMTYLQGRGSGREMIAGFLGLEGAHALEGEVKSVAELYAAGFRMLGLVHHHDNKVGGSSTGETKGGLTEFGREIIERIGELGMIIDLAHASPALIEDVVEISKQPVVASHTGVRGTCDNPRNLSDEQVRGIAQTGGVIGIGYWPTAVCGNSPLAIARAIRYASNLVGVGHVALGSDFDGAVETPFDVTGITQLTEALITNGFSETDVRKIMGENILRVLKEVL